MSQNNENISSGKGLNVLSLCDGMSCGHIALDRVGIKVNKYFAAEIKDIAIKVTKDNYPETIHIGDVKKVSYSNGILYTEYGEFETKIDLVIFGSPCQTLSIAIPTDQRVGLKNLNKSGLFYECNRILHEINPPFFLMENVASMKNSDKNLISHLIGVEPIMLNSSLVAPALRKRYYWTNIPVTRSLPDKEIKLQTILTEGYTDRDKARCLAVIDSRPNSTPIKMFHRYYSTGFTTLIFESKEHYESCKLFYDMHFANMSASQIDAVMNSLSGLEVFDGVRYMNQIELERCQTVPEGYTKCLTRNEAADVLGDGWTIDIIAYILSGLLRE